MKIHAKRDLKGTDMKDSILNTVYVDIIMLHIHLDRHWHRLLYKNQKC